MNPRNAIATVAALVAVLAVSAAPASATEPLCPNAGALGTNSLPDCRAYEMVSSPDKSGGDVIPKSTRTRAAADGGAVTFTSLVSFGDQSGVGYDFEYISERTAAPGTPGWATHGITPLQPPISAQEQIQLPKPLYQGDMSPDLTKGVYVAGHQLPGFESANAVGVGNLYLRDDLRTPGLGDYQLLSEPFAPPPVGFIPLMPAMAAASSDFSKVIFESIVALTADAEENEQQKLYENDDGTLRLVGRIPSSGTECDDGSGPACVPAPSSLTGPAGARGPIDGVSHHIAHMVSADGERVFFQVAAASGGVFARIDGIATVKLNASEKEPPEEAKEAQLWDASVDGSRVFFSTDEGLTEEDDDSSADIYMYDFTGPAGERLTLVSRDGEPADTDNTPVVYGVSEDGRFLYFQMANRLVAGAGAHTTGVYLWHDGATTYLGSFHDPGDTARNGLQLSIFPFGTMPDSRVSPDGRHLLFAAGDLAGFEGHGGLSAGGCPEGCKELLVYDAGTERLRCATCIGAGVQTSQPTLGADEESETGNAGAAAILPHALSDDGRFVFFNTKEALVGEDTNGKNDAYEYDAANEEIHLLSSGTDSAGAFFLEASASGRDAFFATRQALSGWDFDKSRDLYDARIDGGLPEPPPAIAPCEGESCRPASGTHRGAPLVGSGSLGPGNPKPPRRCPRGRHKKKAHGTIRCVKHKHKKKHHRHSPRPSASGRGGSK